MGDTYQPDNQANSDDPIQGIFGLDTSEILSREKAVTLVTNAKMQLSSASAVLDRARTLTSNWGLPVDSSILDANLIKPSAAEDNIPEILLMIRSLNTNAVIDDDPRL
jgi:hypothetical protein